MSRVKSNSGNNAPRTKGFQNNCLYVRKVQGKQKANRNDDANGPQRNATGIVEKGK
jgi:hypothetical protein